MIYLFKLKAARKVAWLAFIALMGLSLQSFTSYVAAEKMQGTYQGLDDNGNYTFKGTDGTLVTFHVMDDSVEIDLYDEEEIGNTFIVQWEYEEWDEYDEDDNVIGTSKVRRITSLSRA